jgi:hypothetical protein
MSKTKAELKADLDRAIRTGFGTKPVPAAVLDGIRTLIKLFDYEADERHHLFSRQENTDVAAVRVWLRGEP